MIRAGKRVAITLLVGAVIAVPALSASKISSKLLVKFYKQECADNIKELKAKLVKDKVMIAGSTTSAAKSVELACAFGADNPTMKKLNDEAWVAETDAFVRQEGVENYAKGAMRTMAINIAGSGIDRILVEAKVKGLTQQQLHLIGQMTRAMAFTEAHVLAARQAYGK